MPHNHKTDEKQLPLTILYVQLLAT